MALTPPTHKENTMKNRLTFTLAILILVVVGALSESTTLTASAQSLPRSQPGANTSATPPAAASLKGVSVHCFCKVIANGTEVAKPTKGWYVQPFQAKACRNYCRGLWDAGPAQRIAWAKLLPPVEFRQSDQLLASVTCI